MQFNNLPGKGEITTTLKKTIIMNSKKRQNFLAGYTGVDAGERRKSDGRERQVFFAPMAESDKFFLS